jgi:hypothetical protein
MRDVWFPRRKPPSHFVCSNQASHFAMSSTSGKEFEFYARDCMRLADQPNVPPELREQLMQMAREWMKAMMEAEDESN